MNALSKSQDRTNTVNIVKSNIKIIENADIIETSDTADLSKENTTSGTFLKDPGSAITHFIGIILSCIGAFLIMSKSLPHENHLTPLACGVFIGSMILLYTASTLYHSINASEKITLFLKKFDHIMIYFLIAGTYTPICLLALPKSTGIKLLLLIWGLTICGLILTAFWVSSPKWLNSTIYIIMGWLCLIAFKPLFKSISLTAFGWLLAGGIIYTIGGVIYALKLPIFNNIHKNFGSHEIFHLFVLAGSICHFYMIYTYLIQ